jgi:hypothetical protein
MNAIAEDIDTAFDRTPLIGVKLLNPLVVQNLGLKETPFMHSVVAVQDSGSEISAESSDTSSTGTIPELHSISGNDMNVEHSKDQRMSQVGCADRWIYRFHFVD